MKDECPKTMWVHVDINSYFATIIQQENPLLRGKPVGIIKSKGRTCIIAASKEAKTFGVTTGCSLKEARIRCPHLITVPAAFPLYLSATQRLKRLCTSLVPHAEMFSLDEAFLSLTECAHLYPDPHTFGSLIQQRIREELGEWVTCNVGIAESKLLAKMASETGKKGSITCVTGDSLLALLATTSFKDVCGVGWGLSARLQTLGVTSLLQISFIPDEQLIPCVGPFWAKELRAMSMGKDPDFLTRKRSASMKSVGRTITGRALCRDPRIIKQTLYNLTAEVIAKVREMRLAGRQIGVFLEGDGKRWGAHVTTQTPVKHTLEMFLFLYDKVQNEWIDQFPVIRFGVSLSLLTSQAHNQEQILPEWQKQERVEMAVGMINKKHGLFAVRSALLLGHSLIFPEVNGYLGDRQYYGL
ncbi:MAG: hypothetical protein HZA34_04300 [Candidatus Pacebacteria bacterium]|nr:hypothetical protein [Candidatus Paceibacterota bacterium]